MTRQQRMACGRVGVILGAIGLALGVSALIAEPGPMGTAPPTLSAEQKERLKTRTALEAEARKLGDEGKVVEAVAAAEKALAISRAVYGKEHAELAGSLSFLAEFREAGEDFDAARKERKEALAILTRLRGADHWQVTDARLALATIDRLAGLTADQRRRLREADRLDKQVPRLVMDGDYDTAVDHSIQALDIRTELLGPEHPTTVAGMIRLSRLYVGHGEPDAADAVVRQARKLSEKVFGAEHPNHGRTLHLAARFDPSLERPVEVEHCFRRAQDILKSSLGKQHAEYTDLLMDFADFYAVADKPAEAERLFREALAIRKAALPAGDPATHATVDALVRLLADRALADKSNGRLASARRIHQEILDLQFEHYGEEHWKTREARLTITEEKQLSRLSPDQRRRLAEAERLMERVRLAREFDLDLTPAEIQRRAQEMRQEGEHLRRALEIRQEVLGKEHRAWAETAMLLARYHARSGELDRAEPLYRQASQTCERLLGKDHPHTQGSLYVLVELYKELGHAREVKEDFAAAKKAWENARAVRVQLHGEKSWHVTEAQLELSRLDRTAALNKEERAKLALARQIIGYPWDGLDGRVWADVLARTDLPHDNELHGPRVLQGDPASIREARQAVETTRKLAGEHSIDHLNALTTLARAYVFKGDHDRAEPILQTVLAARKRITGEKHPGYINSLADLADLYKDLGDHAKAREFRNQAYTLADELELPFRRVATAQPIIRWTGLSADPTGYIATLQKTAQRAIEAGDYVRAEPLCRQVVDLCKKRYGEKHPDYATALGDLAALYMETGDFARAEPLAVQVRDILKQALGEKDPDFAASLHNLGVLYEKMGALDRAEALFRQDQEILKAAGHDKERTFAESLLNLALVYTRQGEHAKAERRYLQALPILEATAGEKEPIYALALNNLGFLYTEIGRFDDAERRLVRARDLRKQLVGEDDPDYADSLHDLALLADARGDSAKAAELLTEALRRTRRNLELATAVQSERRQVAMAQAFRSYLDLYLSVASRARLPAAAVYQEVLAWKGAVFARRQRLLDDLSKVRRQAFLGIGGTDAPKASGPGALVESVLDPKEVEQAWRLSVDPLGLKEDPGDPSGLKEGDVIVAIEKSAVAGIRDVETVARRFAAGQQVQVRVRRDGKERTIAVKLGGRPDPELERLLVELRETGRSLALAAAQVPIAKEDHERWKSEIDELSHKQERLEAELSKYAAGLAKEIKTKPLTAKELQAALPADAVLVDFLEYRHSDRPGQGKGPRKLEPRLAAFVVRPDRDIVQLPAHPVKPIADTVEEWRTVYGYGKKKARKGDVEPASRIRDLVWKPLEPHLVGAKVVLISPDGTLARWPFAALPGKTPNTYLIEEIALAVVPVPQALPELLARPKPAETKPSLLLVGDVAFGGADASPRAARPATGRDFPKLDETEDEIHSIRNRFEDRYPDRDVQILRGTVATEGRFRTLAPDFGWIHLATHGYYEPGSYRTAANEEPKLLTRQDVTALHPGLACGLALAGANAPARDPEEDGDGLLTAVEVADLDLRGSELVVLSACQSGLGDITAGEGVQEAVEAGSLVRSPALDAPRRQGPRSDRKAQPGRRERRPASAVLLGRVRALGRLAVATGRRGWYLRRWE